MNPIKKPKVDEDAIGTNPFIVPLQVTVKEIEFTNQLKKDKDGDWISPKVLLENEPCVKLYVSTDKRKIINKLDDKSKSMLLWIFYTVERNKDYIWINKERYKEEQEIKSENTVRGAVKNLIRYGLIQYTIVKDVYWINPDFFFFGNRVKKYPNNLIKR